MAGVRKEGEGDFRSAKSGLGTSPLSAWMREAHAVRLRAVSLFSKSLERNARDTKMASLNLRKKGDCSQSTRVEREKRDRREREG